MSPYPYGWKNPVEMPNYDLPIWNKYYVGIVMLVIPVRANIRRSDNMKKRWLIDIFTILMLALVLTACGGKPTAPSNDIVEPEQ